ncbi:hypothetical protein Bbelb_028820 [Branchiostoma belcheri]|nr:hypothetical protein Bbelb_028820 [Branchiostoma belcheri]
MDLRIVTFDLVDTGLNSGDVVSTARVVPYVLRVALSLGTDVWLRPSVSDTHFDFQFIVSPTGDHSATSDNVNKHPLRAPAANRPVRVSPSNIPTAKRIPSPRHIRPPKREKRVRTQFSSSLTKPPRSGYTSLPGDPDNLVLAVDYTVEQEYLLKAAYPIRQMPNEGFYTELHLDGALFLNLANYPELKRFCDTSPYLGIHVDYDNRLVEVNDLQNNLAWQHVALTCPDAGLSIEMFHNLRTQNDKISAGFPTQVNFTVSVTNLGGTIPQASRGVPNIALKLLLSDTLDMR